MTASIGQAVVPQARRRDTLALTHDAAAQGLSQVPFVHDIGRWGVMTISTSLGNARFTNLQG